jgi:hypothetical protein
MEILNDNEIHVTIASYAITEADVAQLEADDFIKVNIEEEGLGLALVPSVFRAEHFSLDKRLYRTRFIHVVLQEVGYSRLMGNNADAV